jgi:dTDP-glucose pyrophosphorylase
MKKFLLNLNKNIKDALFQLEQIDTKCLIIVDIKNNLKGTLTDGDVRRALLKGADINMSVKEYIRKKPLFIKINNSLNIIKNKKDIEKKITKKFLKKIKKNHIDVIPIINKKNFVIDVIPVKNVQNSSHNEKLTKIPALIMAGGKGTRLKPFTNYFPKPLTPVKDKTAIETIIDSFSTFGIKEFYISLNYKKNLIKSYLKESKILGLKFIEEKTPLGTAGSISMLKGKISSDFFVINCDSIIQIDLKKFYEFHKSKNFQISLVAATKNFKLSYGSCEINKNGELKKIVEKPKMNFLVNTGLYLFKSDVINLIPKNKFFEMDFLIKKVKQKGGKVGVFPMNEDYWKDVGEL